MGVSGHMTGGGGRCHLVLEYDVRGVSALCQKKKCLAGVLTIATLQVCSEICGPGLQMRDVICTNLTESDPEMAAIEEGYCDSTQRPAESVECFLQNCPGM